MRKRSLLGLMVAVPPLFAYFLRSPLFSTSFLVIFPVLVVSTVLMATFMRKKVGPDPDKDFLDGDEKGIAKFPSEEEEEELLELVQSEDFDFEYASSSSVSESPEVSEFSTTDDEDDGLIEIDFEEGKPISLNDNSQKMISLDDFSESIFRSRNEDFEGLSLDVDEINEEDNLIELDISMGSIKMQRLEVGA